MADWCVITDGVRFGTKELHCERCHGRVVLVLPQRVSELLTLFNGFERLHGGCEERAARGGET